ncbi:hypothetical protein Tco_0530708 [Tanacetum coccineum]
MSTLKFAETHNMVSFLEKPTESEGFEQIIDFLNVSSSQNALTINPTIYVSCIDQFWTTGEVKKFRDGGGVECLPNSTILEEMARIGYEKPSQKLTFYKAFFTWNKFSSTEASAIICLATNQKINFSKFILEGMLRNLDPKAVKFLMYPRFIQLFVKQVEGLPSHHRKYVVPCHTKKIFANMKRINKDFSGNDTPLFPTMVVQTSTPPSTITTTPIPSTSTPTTTTPTPT